MLTVFSTGEIPWVKAMIDKYHDTAHRNGAIVSNTCGPKRPSL